MLSQNPMYTTLSKSDTVLLQNKITICFFSGAKYPKYQRKKSWSPSCNILWQKSPFKIRFSKNLLHQNFSLLKKAPYHPCVPRKMICPPGKAGFYVKGVRLCNFTIMKLHLGVEMEKEEDFWPIKGSIANHNDLFPPVGHLKWWWL